MRNHLRTPIGQRGATLIIGLVLLLVLSVLAVSTMSGATFGLAMTSNAQYSEDAFQLAETGVDVSIASYASGIVPPIAWTQVTDPTDPNNKLIGQYRAQTQDLGNGPPPTGTNSALFDTCVFGITADGQASRGAQEQHVQEFQVLCPKP